MAATKYGKYILTKPRAWVPPGDLSDEMPPPERRTQVLYVDANFLKGASLFAECNWIWPGSYASPSPPHAHDFDELMAFIGSNPDNTADLGGEIELWLGDEKQILTETCLVYVPKGLKHGPLIFRRVDRPIFNFATGAVTTYTGEKRP